MIVREKGSILGLYFLLMIELWRWKYWGSRQRTNLCYINS